MITAKAIVEVLQKNDTKDVFCISGSSIFSLLQEISLTSINVHNLFSEQALVHAAEGYFFSTGKPGIIIVSSGPGVTNTLTGMSNAFYDNHGILILSGQTNCFELRRNDFQDISMVSGIRHLTTVTIETYDSNVLISELINYFDNFNSYYCKPAFFSIPTRTFNEEVSLEIVERSNKKSFEQIDCTTKIDDVVELLSTSDYPVLLFGAGCNTLTTSNLIANLLKICPIPFLTTYNAIGTVCGEYNLGVLGRFGHGTANFAINMCDLLLVIGARLNSKAIDFTKEFAPNAQKIQVDIDPASFNVYYKANICIENSADYFLTTLLRKITLGLNFTKWHAKLAAYKRQLNELDPGELKVATIVDIVNKIIHDEDLIVTDCGIHQTIIAKYISVKSVRSFLTPSGFGTMGFALPASIGAALGNRKRKIWCFVGDGGMLTSLNALCYIAGSNLNINVLVLNNNSYGLIAQSEKLQSQTYYSTLNSNLDYNGFAKLLKINTGKVVECSDLALYVDDLSNSLPFLLNINC